MTHEEGRMLELLLMLAYLEKTNQHLLILNMQISSTGSSMLPIRMTLHHVSQVGS